MIKGVWREPTVGFQSTPTQIVVTEAIQREKLGHSGLNSDELKDYCIGIVFRVGVEHVLSA